MEKTSDDIYVEGMIAGATITVNILLENHLISENIAEALIRAAKTFHEKEIQV